MILYYFARGYGGMLYLNSDYLITTERFGERLIYLFIFAEIIIDK